ncbi:cytochrome D1 domain-containing protein [Hyphomonas sp.]|uniref:cytochrome D1 domain-containing protein n=1 Tax=Hyphomonas sp. TaxID=87 RepID=UPI00391C7A45
MTLGAALLVAGLAFAIIFRAPAAEQGAAGPVISRDGLNVEFSITSVTAPDGPVMAGDVARLSLKFTDAGTGRPVSGLLPAGWIDPLRAEDAASEEACRTSAGTYLAGYVGIRPMIDLNSYYLVVLNSDPTIAVIDPIIGVRGITKLLTQVILPGRGEDWARSQDEKRVFVAMPGLGSVAAVDLDTFRLIETVPVGERPTRIMVQPDGRYIWVGRTGAEPGVTVLDAETLAIAAQIPTGAGHHELLVTGDNRHAYVTNRDDRTVSVIDVRRLRKTGEFTLTGRPISLAYSDLARAVYIADAETGEVIVTEPGSSRVRATIPLEPGLGPMRVAPGGRFLLSVNPKANTVYVIDTANNQLIHRLEIAGEPFQISFSRSFAFVRSLTSTTVSMIRLADLGGREQVTINRFEAGERPPSDSPQLLPSDLFATAVTEAATMVVSPGDANVYYYMEGMNAPMGSFGGYGHRPLSALVVDRTIKEAAPGEYVSVVKIPATGNFHLILTMDAPQMIQCFPFTAEQNPHIARDEAPLRIAYDTRSGMMAPAGQPVRVRFTLTDTANNGAPYARDDVIAVTFRAPGHDRAEHKARAVGEGVYEVTFTPAEAGAHYVYPAVRSMGLDFGKLPFLTVVAQEEARSGGAP